MIEALIYTLACWLIWPPLGAVVGLGYFAYFASRIQRMNHPRRP
jgi:hypothetical protein